MYQLSYTHTVNDSPGTARDRERRAFNRSLELLKAGRAAGATSREAVDALVFSSRLWSVLLDDLAGEGNELPEELRANLISIGLWVLGECDRIRTGQTDRFDALIDVTTTLRDGLQ